MKVHPFRILPFKGKMYSRLGKKYSKSFETVGFTALLRVALNPGLGGVEDVASAIISYLLF